MNNFTKRFLTSIFLLFFLYFFIEFIIFQLIGLLILSILILNELYSLFTNVVNLKKKTLFIITFLAVLYIAIFSTVIFLFLNGNFFNSKNIFVTILFICAATDIGGYTFGKLIGGKKLTKISPNKTYSGVFGSFILSFLIFYFIEKNYPVSPLNYYFVFIISFTSQIGDLTISYIKRSARKKDTGNILPGHGGLLDRIDGILFALPASIYLVISI